MQPVLCFSHGHYTLSDDSLWAHTLQVSRAMIDHAIKAHYFNNKPHHTGVNDEIHSPYVSGDIQYCHLKENV